MSAETHESQAGPVVPPRVTGSAEDLSRELEQEKRGRARAVAEAEKQRWLAQGVDRLSAAILASASVDDLLAKVLEILVDSVGSDLAVVRLREGDRLRSRVSVGLDEEVAAGFSLPVPEGLPPGSDETDGSPVFVSVEMEAPCLSEPMRNKGLRGVHCLPLLHSGELIGIIYLGARLAGARRDGDWSDVERELMGLLALRAAAAVVRQAEVEALRQGIRSREDILGIVAHDLRNPINVIALAASTLLQRLPDSSSRRPAERIIRGVQRADGLIQGLLEIDAIEGGRFAITTRKVETANMILAAIESQQSLAADASIIISTDISPELPPIEADEERMLEVLENLVGNAIKFTSPGGSLTVGASARPNEILFWVKDSGAGIAAEALPHLFDRFWQARKKDRRGTGLGLTICKAIVEAHGGRIWPETQAGQGTTMFFTVPAVARVPKPAAVKAANILLVDDRPENLLSLKAILERPEYRLVTATNGEEALSVALRETFSVALIDVAMPGMNGFEVAVHLKDLERSRDIPIIFVTAFGDDPQEVHRAYSAGGADYLVKPLDPEIVRKKVAVFVDLSRRRETEELLDDDRTSISDPNI
jgi:signal transduction histidine kinase/FixJ family two-component response regulator